MDQAAVDSLITLLDLEPIEVNIFRGESPDEDRQRTFGGQVAGQALVAASRTVEGMTVHSLHAYFLYGGDPSSPIWLRYLRSSRSADNRIGERIAIADPAQDQQKQDDDQGKAAPHILVLARCGADRKHLHTASV